MLNQALVPINLDDYSVAALARLIVKNQGIITQNQEVLRMTVDDLSAQQARTDASLASLGSEISSEMAELKAALDQIAGESPAVQAAVDRAKAQADKVENLVTQLQSDNPAPPAP